MLLIVSTLLATIGIELIVVLFFCLESRPASLGSDEFVVEVAELDLLKSNVNAIPFRFVHDSFVELSELNTNGVVSDLSD